ncbi:MoaD/ThiS family protein [Nostocaceae cyanobacterium CENA357]|uniref:MoaD/ThiS family protein n=1 Tax=Atlanticothrix silvestris CENA357 TaxID=1725252 RepID=A0A8J7HH48_9CYAN|nr:MoaD/ThiS family protein [Atlanticothrix silvestris]MBH8554956.1 MoaD/ThiS family protein [Atlanticothrix silvestris CENA357]
MVTINIPKVLQKLTNYQEIIETKGSTIDEALNNLCESYENLKAHIYYPNGIVKSHILLAVNGNQVGSETVLNEGDSIDIIIAAAGGYS